MIRARLRPRRSLLYAWCMKWETSHLAIKLIEGMLYVVVDAFHEGHYHG
jgi:hypothetical protein